MNKRYLVVKDLQGSGTFGMNRVLTNKEWKEQALDWCYVDDNGEMYKYFREQKASEKLTMFIGEFWDLLIEKYDPDNKEHQELLEAWGCEIK